MTFLSIPSLVMIPKRITPPDEPSLIIANDNAKVKEEK